MKQGTRVIILNAGEHELGPRNMSGKIAGVCGANGYKVEVDGLRGGLLYFRASQLKAYAEGEAKGNDK